MSKYPGLVINATGSRGNVFAVIGNAAKALEVFEGKDAADKLKRECMVSDSFAEVLEKVREFFPVAVEGD